METAFPFWSNSTMPKRSGSSIVSENSGTFACFCIVYSNFQALLRPCPAKMLSPRTIHTVSFADEFSPMINAWASPSGLGCTGPAAHTHCHARQGRAAGRPCNRRLPRRCTLWPKAMAAAISAPRWMSTTAPSTVTSVGRRCTPSQLIHGAWFIHYL